MSGFQVLQRELFTVSRGGGREGERDGNVYICEHGEEKDERERQGRIKYQLCNVL